MPANPCEQAGAAGPEFAVVSVMSFSHESRPSTWRLALLSLSRSTAEEIAARAYRLWLERGGPAGDPDADWRAAEADIVRERLSGALRP